MTDDEDEPPLKPFGLGPAFWGALGFGLVCVIAGYLFARFAPMLPIRHP